VALSLFAALLLFLRIFLAEKQSRQAHEPAATPMTPVGAYLEQPKKIALKEALAARSIKIAAARWARD